MEAKISNYYIPNENNQITLGKINIKSRGRIKQLGTKNDQEYDEMVPISISDCVSINSNYQALLKYFEIDQITNSEILSMYYDQLRMNEVNNTEIKSGL